MLLSKLMLDYETQIRPGRRGVMSIILLHGRIKKIKIVILISFSILSPGTEHMCWKKYRDIGRLTSSANKEIRHNKTMTILVFGAGRQRKYCKGGRRHWYKHLTNINESCTLSWDFYIHECHSRSIVRCLCQYYYHILMMRQEWQT